MSRKEQGQQRGAEGRGRCLPGVTGERGVSELQAESRWGPGVKSGRGGGAGSGLGAWSLTDHQLSCGSPEGWGWPPSGPQKFRAGGQRSGNKHSRREQSSRKAVGWVL